MQLKRHLTGASRRSRLVVAAVAIVALGGTASALASSKAGPQLPSSLKIGPASAFESITKYCGKKPIKVALADGFGGNSWRKITRAEFEDEASKCKNITQVLYTDGQNNPQKAIADIQGLVAQGVNALVVFPDAGPAMLPAIRAAYKAGVSVVPYTSFPGGTPGKDYVTYVAPNSAADGTTWANWLVKVLHGKGNIVFLGGTPGNNQSNLEWETAKAVFDKNPGIKPLINGPVDTNWDPAQTQKVVAGLLAKYPKIDGIMSDYGGGSVGGIRAFVAANRQLVPWAANDGNEFACMYTKYHKTNPNFQIMTINIRTWLVRHALVKAVAAAEGIKNTSPEILNMPVFDDSTNPKLGVHCDPSLPPDATLSTHLSQAKLKALFAK